MLPQVHAFLQVQNLGKSEEQETFCYSWTLPHKKKQTKSLSSQPSVVSMCNSHFCCVMLTEVFLVQPWLVNTPSAKHSFGLQWKVKMPIPEKVFWYFVATGYSGRL